MGWLDALERRAREAVGVVPAAPAPRTPTSEAAQAKRDSIAMGSDRGADRPDDPGAAEPVFYFVEDGILSMCDENGKPTGKGTALGPDDDPRRVAGRLKLAALNERPDFNRRLNYQPLGVA